ncbi:LOW QUALITY PROTEIN: hypothetical protein V2J09_015227 [Rumex salicifolius]
MASPSLLHALVAFQSNQKTQIWINSYYKKKKDAKSLTAGFAVEEQFDLKLNKSAANRLFSFTCVSSRELSDRGFRNLP